MKVKARKILFQKWLLTMSVHSSSMDIANMGIFAKSTMREEFVKTKHVIYQCAPLDIQECAGFLRNTNVASLILVHTNILSF